MAINTHSSNAPQYGITSYMIPYLVAIVLGFVQWRRTTGKPQERAAPRWFILSIWINIGLAGTLVIVPNVMKNYETIPLWVPAFSVLLMFICFALGILRCGLFILERWWLSGWVWLCAGLLIAGIDLLSVYILDVGFQAILPRSILLLGWVYFPLRQWLWKRLPKSDTDLLEQQLPTLIRSLIESQPEHAFMEKWSSLLEGIFNPLKLEDKKIPRGPCAILNHGLVLQIPSLDGCRVYQLTGNRQGTQLFSHKDETIANALVDLSRAIFAITNRTLEVEKKGASEERERIMRDLHDDVLPKLITIRQRSPNGVISGLAEAAFQSIRETIYIVRNSVEKPLEEIFADWRAELTERLAPFGIGIRWELPDQLGDICFTPLQYINCSRILREAISNIVQHADATQVRVHFSFDAGHIYMDISDNGRGAPKKALDGMGTSNMRLRTKALEGHIDWHSGNEKLPGGQKGVTVSLSFPMESHGDPSFDYSPSV